MSTSMLVVMNIFLPHKQILPNGAQASVELDSPFYSCFHSNIRSLSAANDLQNVFHNFLLIDREKDS